MCGEAGTAKAGREAPSPPIEPVSAVHDNTLAILSDANGELSMLLRKVRGSQPDSGSNKAQLEKVVERTVLGDSRNLRDLATQIFDKARELHRYIGHEKQ